MRTRVVVAIIAAIVLLAAAVAVAGVGSVIHSFQLSGNVTPVGSSLYRDATGTYLYALFYTGSGGQLRTYSPYGTFYGSLPLAGSTGNPIDAGDSLVGTNYIGVLDGGAWLRTYELATGSLVASLAVPTSKGYDCDRFGGYTYFSRSDFIYQYNSSGSLLASFPGGSGAGTLACARSYNNLPGDYVVVMPSAMGDHPCGVFTAAGAAVGTFSFSGPYPNMDLRGGASCGAATPTSYGDTLWVEVAPEFMFRMAFQVDLGNAGAGVVPASLGAVKALYR
jgi:hypothetical protein